MNNDTSWRTVATAGDGQYPVRIWHAWVSALFLSASSMMIETIAYRQWRVFLRMDSLPFVLPMVMAGLAAGAIVFYLAKRKTHLSRSMRHDFVSVFLVAYALLSPVPFLLLPLCMRVQPLTELLLETGSALACFLLFLIWGYVNSALFYRYRDKIFPLYSAILLGTILGVCAAIILMDTCGAPRALSFNIAAAVITGWAWIVMNTSTWKSSRYTLTVIALAAIAFGFSLSPARLTVFHEDRSPVWFDSNSFSQLEMYPVEPIKILRAPAVTASVPTASNVQAWRVYFDGLDFYYTDIVRYSALKQVKFLEQDLSSLAFQLGDPGRALIFGAGGGVEVIQGLLAGFREIDAVEINPLVIKAVQQANASDFMNAAGVRYHIADGRRFLQGNHMKYDLIFMPNVRSQGAKGVVNRQYMNTVELIGKSLDMVDRDGVFVIRIHFHDWPSLSGTLKAALKTRPMSEGWSLFLASEVWKKRAYHLVVLRRGPLTSARSRKLSDFINKSGFRWTQVDLGALKEGLPVLTNDHPYAASFHDIWQKEDISAPMKTINVSSASLLMRLVIPLTVAIVIILSLMILQARQSHGRLSKLLFSGGGYSASLGSGFLAAEIVFIEKTFLVIGNPTLAFGITVSSLMGSGLLALWVFRNFDSQRLSELLPMTALAASFALCPAFLILEKLAFVPVLSYWPRILLPGFVIFAAGSTMGVLFPAGLRLLGETTPDSIPWNWAINGVAAVVGGTGAELTAIILGYRAALGFAAVCYILAATAAFRTAKLLRAVRVPSES